jgi:hypothetical protein
LGPVKMSASGKGDSHDSGVLATYRHVRLKLWLRYQSCALRQGLFSGWVRWTPVAAGPLVVVVLTMELWDTKNPAQAPPHLL